MATKKAPKSITDPKVRFFYEHAGYAISSGETEHTARLRNAKALADAEEYAADQDWAYDWEEESRDEAEMTFGDEETWENTESYSVALRDESDNSSLAALGGVSFPRDGAHTSRSRDYRRVVEAELALEAITMTEGHTGALRRNGVDPARRAAFQAVLDADSAVVDELQRVYGKGWGAARHDPRRAEATPELRALNDALRSANARLHEADRAWLGHKRNGSRFGELPPDPGGKKHEALRRKSWGAQADAYESAGHRDPAPKFQLGDRVKVMDGRKIIARGKVSFNSGYDAHLGQYRYKVEVGTPGDRQYSRLNYNENSLRLA
jgi:hypothetical protein